MLQLIPRSKQKKQKKNGKSKKKLHDNNAQNKQNREARSNRTATSRTGEARSNRTATSRTGADNAQQQNMRDNKPQLRASQQAQAAAPEQNNQQTVYVTPTGSKYHTHKCGNGTYTPATLSEARSSFNPLLQMLWKLIQKLYYNNKILLKHKKIEAERSDSKPKIAVYTSISSASLFFHLVCFLCFWHFHSFFLNQIVHLFFFSQFVSSFFQFH